MLDKKMEDLGVMYQRQYDLLKGVMNSDKKKFDKLNKNDISDKDIIEILVSKTIGMIFE